MQYEQRGEEGWLLLSDLVTDLDRGFRRRERLLRAVGFEAKKIYDGGDLKASAGSERRLVSAFDARRLFSLFCWGTQVSHL